MGKVCIACGLVPPKPKPTKTPEDCPGCGKKGTVRENSKRKVKNAKQ